MTGLNRDLNRERKRIQMSAANSAAVKKGDDKVETQSLKELLLGNARSYGIFFALVVVIIVFQILTGGRLLNPNNVVALFQQNAYVLIAAIGMLMVIIATHIDLSVGSVVAFIGGVGALAMKNWGLNWFLAIVLMIVIGLAIGAWHGFWVAYVGVPGFVTTLGGMLIFRGLATVVAGESIPVSDPTFRAISKDYLPNVLGFWGDFSSNAIIVGVVAIVLVIWMQLHKRNNAISWSSPRGNRLRDLPAGLLRQRHPRRHPDRDAHHRRAHRRVLVRTEPHRLRP